jgi:hypothetical protein
MSERDVKKLVISHMFNQHTKMKCIEQIIKDARSAVNEKYMKSYLLQKEAAVTVCST